MMDDQTPITLSHHCQGYLKSLADSTVKTFHNCFEVRATGELVFDDDGKNERVVNFCPLCGKESRHHAALINQKTVRMVI